MPSIIPWIVLLAPLFAAAGYNVAFLTLGAVAGAGFALYLLAMPETMISARQAG